ncbi:AzlD family membrane protein [Desulfolithobacter dissulfuricans]|uniref:AzlD family membrane protein n=1 Tax=Desulfolithobacter dissulfuricans TaxID=2795293 RepID=A0A915TZE1_9BACT|nr:AzlD domain-containing protein [Desulfolithobacter dissulfuricans]BCO08594.1 AzlD family membrane protein [Desulfolithobacter dissulfuricans]
MSFSDYLLLFFCMGLVTYVPRWLPLFYLSHRRLPQWLVDWLSLIPVAILSSLLAPILLADTATRNLDLGKPELLVAVPTLFFALKTKSLGGTVLVGMVLYWLAGMLFGVSCFAG